MADHRRGTAAGAGHAPARRLQRLDGSAHAAFLAEALRWSTAAAGHLGEDLRYLNAGGGFGIDDTGDRRFDPAALSTVDVPPGGRPLVVEPGRCLAADAGWYAAEVIDLERTHGRRFAVLRGGIHHLGPPATWGPQPPRLAVPVPAARGPRRGGRRGRRAVHSA